MKIVLFLSIAWILTATPGCSNADFGSAGGNNNNAGGDPTGAPQRPAGTPAPGSPNSNQSGDHPDGTTGSPDNHITTNGINIDDAAFKKAVRVGINFEDLANGDFDFNDAVLCFTGAFRINEREIYSYSDQSVSATTFSDSGCMHNIEVKIRHDDGTTTMQTYGSRSTAPVTLAFKAKSKLEVTMTWVGGNESCIRRADLSDPKQVQVLPDRCNTR